MMMPTRNFTASHHDRAVTLIELLMCVAIVTILVSIAVVSYQFIFVKMDKTDLRDVFPSLISDLKSYQKEAREENAVIEVEFLKNEPAMRVTTKKPGSTKTERETIKKLGLFGRQLKWRDYVWPDGSNTPRTWTFFSSGAVEGGKVFFGSNHAECSFYIQKNQILGDLPEE